MSIFECIFVVKVEVKFIKCRIYVGGKYIKRKISFLGEIIIDNDNNYVILIYWERFVMFYIFEFEIFKIWKMFCSIYGGECS